MNKIDLWIKKNLKVNLENKNVFITGGNSGIGFSLAKHCVKLNANVFLLVRNLKKGEKAKQELLSINDKAKVRVLELDLSSFSSIKSCAEEIKKYDVDYFVNNAGVYRVPKGKTLDGLEIVLGTNFFGVLYLSDLLKDYFTSLSHKVSVVFTTSVSSKWVKIKGKDYFLEKHENPIKVYGKSKKLINSLYFNCCDEYKDSNVVVHLVHPGITYSPLIEKGYKNKFFSVLAKVFMKMLFHSTDKAALIHLYAFNLEYPCVIGPRGLFSFSGFPKKDKFNKDKKYKEHIISARKKIEEILTAEKL